MSELEDRRQTRRQRILKGARIVYGNFLFVQDCFVRDVSDGGAQLRTAVPAPVPDAFHLFLNDERSIRPVKVVWRKGRDLGVSFEGDAKNVLQAGDPRLKRFEFV